MITVFFCQHSSNSHCANDLRKCYNIGRCYEYVLTPPPSPTPTSPGIPCHPAPLSCSPFLTLRCHLAPFHQTHTHIAVPCPPPSPSPTPLDPIGFLNNVGLPVYSTQLPMWVDNDGLGDAEGFLAPQSGLFPAPLPPLLLPGDDGGGGGDEGGIVGGSSSCPARAAGGGSCSKALVQRRRAVIGRFRFLGRLAARCLLDGQVS